MARQISENGTVRLNLTKDEKEELSKLASSYGYNTLTPFVAAIAKGKYHIISDDAYLLLEKIKEERSARKARYEESKRKEKESEDAND